MGKMKIVPMKLICSVPGCKNVNTLNFTKNGEMRNGVNICTECIGELKEYCDVTNAALASAADQVSGKRKRGKADTVKAGEGE